MLPYNKHLKPFSQKLRREMTDTERVLWARIRKKQICGVQFYRQKPLGKYIVDFYCPQALLVIEVDGSQHFEIEMEKRDRIRDEYLCNLGLIVLRFANSEVRNEPDAVLERIYLVIIKRLNLP